MSGALCDGFLRRRERGSPVTVETVRNWNLVVDEIEAAGMVPHLVHGTKHSTPSAPASLFEDKMVDPS